MKVSYAWSREHTHEFDDVHDMFYKYDEFGDEHGEYASWWWYDVVFFVMMCCYYFMMMMWLLPLVM